MSELLIENGIEEEQAKFVRSALSVPRVRPDRECIALVNGLLDEVRGLTLDFKHP